MKTLELNKFTGVRNDISPERFDLGDLVSGVNVELDETGKPYMRRGSTVLNPTSAHSLWAEGDRGYVVRNGTIHKINPDFSFTDSGVSVGNRVTYTKILDDVFFSDGRINGIMGVDGYRPWGIVPPAKPPVFAGAGDLLEGTYLITMTFVRRSGQESGASPLYPVTVGPNSSLIFPTLPVSTDPLADTKRLYVSDRNGEVAYLIAELLNSNTVCTVSSLPAARTVAVRTLRMGPPPGGQLVNQYGGSTYVADSNYLWYSQPYEFELFHRSENYLGFSSPVRTFAPVSNGVFLGSDDETVFLDGMSPQTFESKPLAPYGTVQGSERQVSEYYVGKDGANGLVQLWMSKKGLCAGFDGGSFKNLTGGRYTPPSGVSSGASLLKLRGGTPQFVTTLFS